MGAGKTLVGALVAERSRAPFFDLDHLVEDKAGMSIHELFAAHSEEAFRAFEKATLPTVLRPGAVVALGGGGTIADDSWLLVAAEETSGYHGEPVAASS